MGMLKYLREAIELRRQAKDLFRAEKRLAKSDLDYHMLEMLIQHTNKEITVNMANGVSITIKDSKGETGYKSFADQYADLHK